MASRFQDASPADHADEPASGIREPSAGERRGLRIRSMSCLEEAAALRADWEALYQRSPCASAAQSYDFVTTARELGERYQRGRVIVVVATAADDLVCVAPLWLRKEGTTLVAGTLGSGGREEYADPLLADCSDKELVVTRILEHAAALADVLRVTNIRASSPFAVALSRSRQLVHHSTTQTPVVSLRGASSWEEWLGDKSSTFRRRNRQEWNRLAKVGNLTTSYGGTPTGARAVIDWTFDAKADWLAERSISDSWLLDDFGRQLFTTLASTPGRRSCLRLVALQVDGRFVAASVGLRSRDRMEGLVTSYDPEFSAYRPGLVLVQAVVRDAYENGLDFDFRLSPSGYKMRWADRVEEYASFDIACSAKASATSRDFGCATRARSLAAAS